MSAVPQRKPAASGSPHQFVINVYDRPQAGPGAQLLWSTIWGGRSPLGVGFPFQWVLEKRQGFVRLSRVGMATDKAIPDPVRDLPFSNLAGGDSIALEWAIPGRRKQVWLEIQPVRDLEYHRRKVEAAGWAPSPIPDTFVSGSETDTLFKRAALSISSTLLLGWLVLTMLPKPPVKKFDDTIPPQFAKTVLSPVLRNRADKNAAAAAAAGRKGGGFSVVQAFKSEKIVKQTKQLLSADATKGLLATSSLLDGAAAANVVRRVFDGKSGNGSGGAGQRGIDPKALIPNTTGQIGFLGGQGPGKGGGTADYGSGRGVAVAGQGSSQIGVSTEGAGVSEGLTKDEVGLVIRQHLDEVRYCYESALVRTPGFEGKLVVNFVIQKLGGVKSATPKESSGDARLDTCITSRLLKWTFPKPRGGVDVGVSYPFIFKSLGG